MGFVAQFDGVRILKARRLRALKGRPEWQDTVPEEPEAKDAYRIAAKHEASFARAFLSAVRNLLDDETERDFKRAWRDGTFTDIVDSIPLLQEGLTDPKSRIWSRFIASMEDAYRVVIEESARASLDEINQNFKTEFVLKAKKKEPIWTVPVSPEAIAWTESQSANLVVEITREQQQLLRDILSRAFEQGLRAETTYKLIRENIGLTERDYKAVLNREALHRKAGLPSAKVDELTEKYRLKKLRERAERIARTETITAQAQGRKAAWQTAKDTGALPAVEREWIAAPPSPRTCKICLELDGKRAPVDGSYESAYLGAVEGPTAHPGCRCTEKLVRAEG